MCSQIKLQISKLCYWSSTGGSKSKQNCDMVPSMKSGWGQQPSSPCWPQFQGLRWQSAGMVRLTNIIQDNACQWSLNIPQQCTYEPEKIQKCSLMMPFAKISQALQPHALSRANHPAGMSTFWPPDMLAVAGFWPWWWCPVPAEHLIQYL